MTEIQQYEDLKSKLLKACSENNLSASLRNEKYPFLLTIRPVGGMDAQQTMIEGMDAGGDTGYISPDASLVFAYRDGALSYKISETFTISDKLFNKIKGLFKNLHAMWMMHFFRDRLECTGGYSGPQDAGEAATGDDACPDEFAEFMDDAEPAVDDTEE